MFTGLVQALGTVSQLVETPTGRRLTIDAAELMAISASPPVAEGESIAVNGCCLTVALPRGSGGGPSLSFDVIPQTLRLTTLGRLVPGARVNLERCATPATLLGGHIVQGHVDGVGTVATLRRGEDHRVAVTVDRGLLPFLQPRGSVALDGVSLTVAGLDDAAAQLEVALIPTTIARTTLGSIEVGSCVNVEVDCLARMVARLIGRG